MAEATQSAYGEGAPYQDRSKLKRFIFASSRGLGATSLDRQGIIDGGFVIPPPLLPLATAVPPTQGFYSVSFIFAHFGICLLDICSCDVSGGFGKPDFVVVPSSHLRHTSSSRDVCQSCQL